ncbi:unnamed protein product [Cuscuta epithymum]|uniref:Uncharacterized protein n=1 Tax=Cuscuta epithymum TaxID=186058 RepID=A0AAV0DW67_9ASTE|nr:unnamed protein product [Cuscuta epithymum]
MVVTVAVAAEVKAMEVVRGGKNGGMGWLVGSGGNEMLEGVEITEKRAGCGQREKRRKKEKKVKKERKKKGKWRKILVRNSRKIANWTSTWAINLETGYVPTKYLI